MEPFRETLLILISTPLYAVVIGAEIFISYLHHHKKYSTYGFIENIYLMLLNMGLDILMRFANLAVFVYFAEYAFFKIENPIVYWIVLLVAEDFLFFLLHYVDHYVRFFWAIHVTHHSSEEFNLTVGFRSSVFQPLYRIVYFIPLAFCGFEPADVFFMYSATQIYGILIHTQYVGKLGFLEHIFATPSNHRVHHGSNHIYLDRNMGMVFIFWDKLFGTYTPETEPVKYGLTENIGSHHPAKVVFHEWQNMWRDVKKAPNFRSKFMYVFGPPGWSHDGSRKTSRQLRALAEKKVIG
ncbi:MAG TPA: sterol desaturase family protein [Flavobacteriales bacterium]|nr:sterol desaturase family protein [Flavobacteriales bacterium]